MGPGGLRSPVSHGQPSFSKVKNKSYWRKYVCSWSISGLSLQKGATKDEKKHLPLLTCFFLDTVPENQQLVEKAVIYDEVFYLSNRSFAPDNEVEVSEREILIVAKHSAAELGLSTEALHKQPIV